jgi:glycine/D-amino acid oxidase-like deaminating enzyme
MSARCFDLAMIGAGIVGAACALEATREGMSVVVREVAHA